MRYMEIIIHASIPRAGVKAMATNMADALPLQEFDEPIVLRMNEIRKSSRDSGVQAAVHPALGENYSIGIL